MNASTMKERLDASPVITSETRQIDVHYQGKGKPEAAEPLEITATPHIWRDPETIPQRPWIFGRWLMRGVCMAAIASGGAGKTTFFAAVDMSLVSGRNLLGKDVWGGPKRVWVWNLEDPKDELDRGIQAAAKHYGLCREDLEGRYFVDCSMEGKGLCTATENTSAGFTVIEPVYEAIKAEIKRRQIDVLRIDPFVSSHEVGENENSKIDKIAKAWARVANDTNCAIILVHHSNKQGAKEVTVMSSRGGVALTDACRGVLVFNRMDDKTAKRLNFNEADRRRYFTVTDDKHNRAPAEGDAWFKLESVDLGNGGNFFNPGGDSVGVAVPWGLPEESGPSEGLGPDDVRKAQASITEGEWRLDPQAAKWAGQPIGEALGIDDKKRVKAIINDWTTAGYFLVEEGQDDNRKFRKFLKVGKQPDE